MCMTPIRNPLNIMTTPNNFSRGWMIDGRGETRIRYVCRILICITLSVQIALSRSHLLRKITALTGVSVNELIRTFRLQRAAQLLEQSWGPVTQVAYEVGFSNLSYFSKVFKEQYGVLPSEFPAAKSTSNRNMF